MSEPKPQGKWDYVKILTVFALTGTTSSFAPRFILPYLNVPDGWLYYLVYFLLITPVYLVLLFAFAFLFGKFDYFWDKQKKLALWVARIFRKRQETTT